MTIVRSMRRLCFLAIAALVTQQVSAVEPIAHEIVYDEFGHIVLEELTITAARPPLTAEQTLEAYDSYQRGKELFEEEKYQEALPYILTAAKAGYKESQWELAMILLQGRGGVPRNDVQAIGWFAASAKGEKANRVVKRHFETLMDAVPVERTAALMQVVNKFRDRYGRDEPIILCKKERFTSSFVHALRCFFTDPQVANLAFELDSYQQMYTPDNEIYEIGVQPYMEAPLPSIAPSVRAPDEE